MRIIGTDIIMTRGDSESITVAVINRPLVDGDIIELTVRKCPEAKAKEIYKKVDTFDDGKAVIEIAPEDTEKMCFGDYVYDVQLTMADGTVTTIIKPSAFVIGKEVTYG